MTENLGLWNKATFEVFAEKTPETCPECDDESNFRLIKEKENGPIQVMEHYYLKHCCGWEKEITPWELA